MPDSVVSVNGKASEESLTNSDELLQAINTSATDSILQTVALTDSWAALNAAIDPTKNEGQFTALKKEIEQREEQDDVQGGLSWPDELFSSWIRSDNQHVKIEFARLAAIRLLARIAGEEPRHADDVFWKLWEVIYNQDGDSPYTVDARAWALYSLYFCDVEMDSDRWDKTFGLDPDDTDAPGIYWLESVAEAKVRAEAVKAISTMAQSSSLVACRDAQDKESCSRTLHYCRLTQERFDPVVKMLILHWGREIDYEVKRELVNALGNVAGWSSLPENEPWEVLTILRRASDWDDYETRLRVPMALREISINLLYRTDISQAQLRRVLGEIVDVAIEVVLSIENSSNGGSYSRSYDLQRQYVLTLRQIAVTATSNLHQDRAEEILVPIVAGLFQIADSSDYRQNDLLRRLALYLLKKIVERHTRLSEIAFENYQRMLADPEPEVAAYAAENIVALKGEQEAADYFLDVILEDRSIDEAIEHRRKNWKIEDEDLDYLATEVRKRAALQLGAIPNNGTQHDKLVETLRSDPIQSGRARDALIVMGGERAVESIVNYNIQQQVTDRFFEPMEEARKKGWELLEDVRNWSGSNYRYAYYIAIVTAGLGISIFIIGLLVLFFGDNTTAGFVSVGGGLLLSFAAGVGAYLWEPVKGLNKVAAELSRLIMSFENYLGRMRLIGLGFAHAYTQNSFDQLQFLKRISEMTSDAMRESASSLADVGDWPGFFERQSAFATVPDLVEKPLAVAKQLVQEAELELVVANSEYHKDKVQDTILSQIPGPGTFVTKGSTVEVVPSARQVPIVEVPDFTGESILGAVAMAQEAGLILQPILFSFDGVAEEGTVISQDLRKELQVSMNTSLQLTIAKNGELPASEPDEPLPTDAA